MARFLCTVLIPMILMVLSAPVLRADEPEFMEVLTSPGTQIRGARLGAAEMHLSLPDAIQIALQHNINLEVSRLSLARSQQGILAAGGIFDPVLEATLRQDSSVNPATNALVGADVNTVRGRTFNASLGHLLPTGGSVSLGWANSRRETNSAFYYLNPSYSSGLNFNLRQPLLQGFGTDVTRYGIEVARRNRDLSRLEFERIVVSTLQNVESAYWNLVYRLENLKVKQQSLELAQDLLEQTRTRVRIGTSAPIDIVQSEATVAAREQEIILAENQVEDAADQLKFLLGFEGLDDWNSRIVPMDALEVSPATVALEPAIERALEHRLELRSRQIDTEIRQLGVVSAHNSTLPSVDLVAGYGFAGVGGTFTPTDPSQPVVPGSWDDALRQIRDRDYKQWSAGVNVSYRLGNNQTKAELAQRRFELASSRQAQALERQGVIAEVREAVRGLEAGSKSIAAAVKARELAERNLDAELKKFANGMSTNYQVLQIQEDLARVLASELQARVSYRLAMVAYQVAVGNLLENVGVTLRDDAPEVREPHSAMKDVEFLKHRSRAARSVPELEEE